MKGPTFRGFKYPDIRGGQGFCLLPVQPQLDEGHDNGRNNRGILFNEAFNGPESSFSVSFILTCHPFSAKEDGHHIFCKVTGQLRFYWKQPAEAVEIADSSKH